VQNFLRNLLCVTVPGVLVVLVLLELTLRVFPTLSAYGTRPERVQELRQYGDNVSLFAPDQDTRVDYLTGTPNYTFKTNAFGLRSKPVARTKPVGTLRILCVGDSFTEGFGVDQADTFPNRLDTILNDIGIRSEVLCAAVSGRHIWDYVDMLHHFGKQLQPDIVIVGIYSGNDIMPVMLNGEDRVDYVAAYGFLVPVSLSRSFRSNNEFGSVYLVGDTLSGLDHWLWERSRLYRLVSNRAMESNWSAQFLAAIGMVTIRPRIDPLNLPALVTDADLYATRGPASEAAKPLYNSAAKAYGKLVDFCRSRSTPMVVLSIPEGWRHPLWAFQGPTLDPKTHDGDRVHGFFLELNQQYGIPYRDLLPVYRSGYASGNYSLINLNASHGHFSRRDNLVVSLILLDLLREEGLVSIPHDRLKDYFLTHLAKEVDLPFSWAEEAVAGAGVRSYESFSLVDCHGDVLEYEGFSHHIEEGVLGFNSFPPNGMSGHAQYLQTEVENPGPAPQTFCIEFGILDGYNAGNFPGRIRYQLLVDGQSLWDHDASAQGTIGWQAVSKRFPVAPSSRVSLRIAVTNNGAEPWNWGNSAGMSIKGLRLWEKGSRAVAR
jgi:hypothetical protein